MGSALHTRSVTDDEFAAFNRVSSIGFGNLPTDEGAAEARALLDLDRTVAVFDSGEIVGVAGSYRFELTLPGGTTAPVAGVTDVAVLPTHRRRGVLRSMVVHQLDDVARRGEVAAILNASEAAIYERFGYGQATEWAALSIRPRGTAFVHPVPERTMRLVPKQDAGPLLAPIHEAHRLTHPGEVDRSEAWWRQLLGDRRGWRGGGPWMVVVAQPAGTDPGGYAVYEMTEIGDGAYNRLNVLEMAAATDDTEAALWRFLLEVDLVAELTVLRPVDDQLRWRLVDPRRVRTTGRGDYLWVRVLDVAAALSARRYRHDGVLVLDVVDGERPSTGGRFRLEVADGVAEVTRLGEPERGDADVALGVSEVGSLLLGGVAASALARAARIRAASPEALALADTMFVGERLPFCATRF